MSSSSTSTKTESSSKPTTTTTIVEESEQQSTPTTVEPLQITWTNTRYFSSWLQTQNIGLIVTSYKTQQVYSIGLTAQGEVTVWFTDLLRPMGLAYHKDALYCSNMGNIMKYVNKGSIKDPKYGVFDVNFIPKKAYFGADIDIHDLVIQDQSPDGLPIYCSALFSTICKPSETKTFEKYYTPPWISRLSAEDRSHVNGICLVDDTPRYITSACMRDTVGSWREHTGEGVVYDIVESKVVCEGMYNPHSPRWHMSKLWVLESGTGQLGYVDFETKKLVPCCFIPGFLRGMALNENYAIILTSLDRHDTAFKHIPLGKILEEKGATSKCAIWIVNLDTYDAVHHLEFNPPVTELYDVCVIPNCRRPRIFDVNDTTIINRFYI